MTSWPAVHTPPALATKLRIYHWVIALCVGFVVPPLCGHLVEYVINLGPKVAKPHQIFPGSIWNNLMFIATVSLAPHLLGVFAVWLLMRVRLAGWLVTLLCGGVIGFLWHYVLTIFGLNGDIALALSMFAPVGVFYAAVFWLTLRLQAPEAFQR